MNGRSVAFAAGAIAAAVAGRSFAEAEEGEAAAAEAVQPGRQSLLPHSTRPQRHIAFNAVVQEPLK